MFRGASMEVLSQPRSVALNYDFQFRIAALTENKMSDIRQTRTCCLASQISTAALISDTSFGQTENTNSAEGMEEALMCCTLRFIILFYFNRYDYSVCGLEAR